MDVPPTSAPSSAHPPLAESWRTDVLGEPYEAEDIPLGNDEEGEVLATLVRRRTAAATGRAVLYVHGFSDYFFQDELARWWVDHGYTFYALDLRKYGRSLRPHQTPFYVTDLRAYFPELDEAYRRITERDGHGVVVLNAHSTGGLIAPLWVSEHRPAVHGLVLNSPWFDLQAPWLVRTAGTAVVSRVGARRPRAEIPRAVTGFYGRSLHADHDGEWQFDTTWKPLDSSPVRAGWVRAIRAGHARLHRGLGLDMPALVLSSERSGRPREMGEEVHTTDIVLNVEQIRRWSVAVGRHVTSVAIPDARHDVILSRPEPRRRAYDEMDRWLRAYVDETEQLA